ncbi:MAG: tetratricopeptide repeat protein [Holophagae bacterium]|nr:tetratricopeptide repeat protein [Holophagae bacterium]
MRVTKYLQLIVPVVLLCAVMWPIPVHAEVQGVSGQLQTALIDGVQAKTKKEQQKSIHKVRRSVHEGGYKIFPFAEELFPPAQRDAGATSFGRALDEWNPEWKQQRFPEIDRLILSGQVKIALGYFVRGISAMLKDPMNIVRLVQSTFEGLYFLGMVFFAIFGIIALIKYGRNFHHDISRYIEMRLSSNFLKVVAISLLYLLPVLFTVPLKYLPMYWALLFSPYISKKERIGLVLNAGLTFVFLLGFMYSARVGSQVSSAQFLYYRSMQMPFSQVEGFNPEPQLELFSKATNRMRRAQFSDAISFYKEINSSSYLYPFALNNIGVAYFHLSEFELARDFFREVAQKTDELETPGYNLAVVMLNTYNLAESDSELKSTYDKNADHAISVLLGQIKEPVPMLEVPGIPFLYSKLFSMNFREDVSSGETSGKKEIVFVVILLALFLLLTFLFRDRDLSESCSRCGKAFRFLESHNDSMCKQCVTVFVKKENLDSGKRMAKVESIRKFNRLRKIVQGVIGFVIPGSYSVFVTGMAIRGVLLYFLFFGCVLLVVSEIAMLSSWFLALPFLLIIVLLGIVNLFGILPKLGEE